jgi:hypothetical protein
LGLASSPALDQKSPDRLGRSHASSPTERKARWAVRQSFGKIHGEMISHASTYKRDKEGRREKERAIEREKDYFSGRSEMSFALESS